MPENPPEQRQEPSPAESVMDEESNFPRGLALRLFIYLVAGHAVAGFLWLLFEAGAK
ncbi:DUF6126 family protein [Streptomyces sp. NPDC050428]|uniref:DUF6126 family protein n=1 Tax=Streptomyces sp. NPDC050428 TaxID=3155757 RepID=UPI00342BDDEB